MDCKECKNYISAYVDSELEKNIGVEIEQHLSDCADCNTLIQTERRTKTLLIESYHAEKAPFSLRAGIRQQLAEQRERPGWFQVLVAKPTSLFAIAIFMLVIVSLVYQTYDSGQISDQVADHYKTHLHGKIDCINCYLRKTENIDDYCSDYGHQFGLITDTKEIYSFITNDLSREIQAHNEYAHNEIEITGWVFYKANFIEIENYRMIDQTLAVNELKRNTIIR